MKTQTEEKEFDFSKWIEDLLEILDEKGMETTSVYSQKNNLYLKFRFKMKEKVHEKLMSKTNMSTEREFHYFDLPPEMEETYKEWLKENGMSDFNGSVAIWLKNGKIKMKSGNKKEASFSSFEVHEIAHIIMKMYEPLFYEFKGKNKAYSMINSIPDEWKGFDVPEILFKFVEKTENFEIYSKIKKASPLLGTMVGPFFIAMEMLNESIKNKDEWIKFNVTGWDHITVDLINEANRIMMGDGRGRLVHFQIIFDQTMKTIDDRIKFESFFKKIKFWTNYGKEKNVSSYDNLIKTLENPKNFYRFDDGERNVLAEYGEMLKSVVENKNDLENFISNFFEKK